MYHSCTLITHQRLNRKKLEEADAIVDHRKHGTMRRTCAALFLSFEASCAFKGQFGRPVSVSVSLQPEECGTCDTARRSLLLSSVLLLTAPATSNAAVDCFTDCFKNCKLIAPKDPEYCQSSCKEYCDQPDRTVSPPCFPCLSLRTNLIVLNLPPRLLTFLNRMD